MSKFEVINKYRHPDGTPILSIPVRATRYSAGYDFAASEDTIIPSYKRIMDELDGYIAEKIPYELGNLKSITKATGLKPALVPTGIKCQLDEDCYLEISARSSTPLNYWLVLANGVGRL